MKTDEPTSMTVCHVLRHFHPVLAGAAERFRRYAPGLRERGINTAVITSRSDPALAEYEVLGDGIQVHRVNAFRTDNGTFDDRLLFGAARKLLLSGVVHADVVQCIEASPAVASDLWRLRSAGFGLVHVGTMVGTDDADLSLPRRIKARLRHAVSLSPFHHLVVSTTQMARWNTQMGAYGRKMTVIPNGVDTNRFRPPRDLGEKQSLRAQLGLPLHGRLVLFVGGLLPRKGLHVLLQAWPQVMREHPDACLVVVGPTDRPTVIDAAKRAALVGYQQELLQLAGQAPGNSVVFVGGRPDVELFYRASNAFVLPSAQEGMGNVVLEAFASGLPCLLTDYVGLPTEEFGQKGREFHCVPREPDALGVGLLALMASNGGMEAMGQRAHCWAEQHMSLHRTLDLYCHLYRKLGHQRSVG